MATHGTPDGLRAAANGRTPAVSPGQGLVHLVLCLLVLVVLLGCAHTPPPPLAAATQAHLGTVGVVAARFTPKMRALGLAAVVQAARPLGRPRA